MMRQGDDVQSQHGMAIKEAGVTRGGAGRKVAVWTFLFFFVKGLLWLIIPAAIYTWGC